MKSTMKASKHLTLVLVLFTAISCNTKVKEEKTLAMQIDTQANLSSESEIVKTKTIAYLQITLKIPRENRPAAAAVYLKYKEPFLSQIDGASSKDLIMRSEDVQVLHGFESKQQASDYLSSVLFTKDIVGELGPLLEADPEVRVYEVFQN